MVLSNLPTTATLLHTGVRAGLIDSTALQTSRILELGCGNTQYHRDFGPTVCRDLANAGFNITGIDILDNSLEPFVSRRMDLSEPDNLLELPEEGFYVVFDDSFTGENRCPKLYSGITQKGMSWQQYLGKLDKSICRILMPGGIYIRGGFKSYFYKKTGGEIERVHIS